MRLLVPLLACVSIASTASAYDYVIRHGKVIDGTGNAWFYADVGIDKDRIVALGDLSAAPATKTFDAAGLVVAPGFIDVHTHVDDDILQHPLAENFVRDGVTTIVSGNCGSSVLDVAKFFDDVRKTGSAVNNATLIGHNSVLRKVKGPIAAKLTSQQLEQAKQIVDQAMRDGAVGFSTGLIYTPGQWSDTEEIIELAKVSAKYGGIYASHMRSESTKILDAIDEALRVGREAKCRVEISHFKLPTDVAVTLGRGKTVDAGSDVTLAKVHAARAAGQEVWVDQYPYTASSTSLSTLLPDRILENGPDAAKKLLADRAERAKVLEEMRKAHEVVRHRTDMSFAVVASTPFGKGKFNGKSIKQVAQMLKLQKQNPSGAELIGADALPEVTMAEQYDAAIEIYLNGGGSGVFHTMDEAEVANILRDPLVGVASDSGIRVVGSGVPHPRGYGTNTRILGRYVRELKVITLEDAVRKMTSQPATAFRFADRGVIRVGAFADLTIFDPDKVIDQATFEQPHQFPLGIRTVIVGGQIVFDGEKMTGAKPGEVIEGPGKK
ncbi:MAG: D-aminoacylase [Tepidisphaeraceae bacterium]